MMRIGLTYTGTEWKHENYARWLRAAEEGIEIVRLDIIAGLKEFDGLVLSGGVDIDPSLYGGSTDYAQPPKLGWEKLRDQFELSALDQAWKQGVPVLGVCRGLQLINIARGGNLLQDLGISGDEMHQNTPEDKRHPVIIDEDSLLWDIAGHGAGIVNSAHHQAVDKPGEGLRVSCRSEDGVIEGMEWADPAGKPFLLAVQWHPERMYADSYADTFLYEAIRDRFIAEVGKLQEKH
jgi:putative glutamine amidotransferase